MWLPAIDLKNGQSVCLYQGDFNQKTVIADDPLKQAQAIETSGIAWLHLVDLDGAKAGNPGNLNVIKQIVTKTSLNVELGGGIRTMQQIQQYLNLGITRIIIGSAALDNPELVKRAVVKFGADKIVVGVDGKNDQVAINGWLDSRDMTMSALIEQMQDVGVNKFIVTDISRDGTMQGPNIKLLEQLQAKFKTSTIIASGGIRDVQDLQDLKKHQINSAVIGKALAERRLTLEQLKAVM